LIGKCVQYFVILAIASFLMWLLFNAIVAVREAAHRSAGRVEERNAEHTISGQISRTESSGAGDRWTNVTFYFKGDTAVHLRVYAGARYPTKTGRSVTIRYRQGKYLGYENTTEEGP